MSVFPKLKTGAVAQYPASREFHFSTQVHRFLDSSEQRYRDFGGARRRWVVALSQLDESELTRLAAFFFEQQGRFGAFDFEDPWTGTLITNCRLEQDRLPVGQDGEFDGQAQLTIVETVAA